MKKQCFFFTFCAVALALAACQAPCNHTPIDFGYDDNVHWAIYDCDNCDINPRLDSHVDEDGDCICDVCGWDFTNIKRLKLPSTLTRIGEGAFEKSFFYTYEPLERVYYHRSAED